MGFVDNNMIQGEAVVYRGKLHWIRYFWGAAWTAAGAFGSFGDTDEQAMARGIIVSVGVALLILAFIDVLTSEFVVTNKRVFLKQGVIARRSVELLLHKIEGLQVDQGIAGRILGFGSISPGGTGGTKQAFTKIAAPLIFRQRVNEQIEATSTGARSAATSA